MISFNEVFIRKLFDYYSYSLEIENIVKTQINRNSLNNSSKQVVLPQLAQDYRKVFNKIRSKQRKPFYTPRNELLPKYIIKKVEHFKNFIADAETSEKIHNLKYSNRKPKITNDMQNVSDLPNFCFGAESAYQYALGVSLIKENPYYVSSQYIPILIVLMPSITEEGTKLSPYMSIECFKKYLSYEYNKDIDNTPLSKPRVLFNPKVLEPYELEYPETLPSGDEIEELAQFTTDILKESPIQNLENCCIDGLFPMLISQNLTDGLQHLYKSIREQDIADIFFDYFSIHGRKTSKSNTTQFDTGDVITTKDKIYAYANHFGSFDKKYPLTTSQREAFACYLKDKNIVPVNGGPGTGKTSLLRAVFGDYTVKSALLSYQTFLHVGEISFDPPILCTSTNNQALINIDDGINSGFKSNYDESGGDILYQRWIDYRMPLKISEDDTRTVDFKNELFAPVISFSPRNTSTITKKQMMDSSREITKNPIYYVECYLKYKNQTIPSDYKKHISYYLRDAVTLFGEKIIENNEKIEARFQNDYDLSQGISEIEKALSKKHIENECSEYILKINMKKVIRDKDKIVEIIEHTEELYSILSKHSGSEKENSEQIRNNYSELAELKSDINTLIKKIQHNSKQIEKTRLYLERPDASPEADIFIDKEFSNLLELRKKQLSEIEDNYDKQVDRLLKTSSLISKIGFNLFNTGSLKKLLMKRSIYTKKIQVIY